MSDLISREAVINALDAICKRECEYSKKQRAYMCGSCHLGSAFDAVDELPFAQPKTGRWGKGNMPTYGGYKCSICGENSISKYLYCPNCGAKMEGWE